VKKHNFICGWAAHGPFGHVHTANTNTACLNINTSAFHHDDNATRVEHRPTQVNEGHVGQRQPTRAYDIQRRPTREGWEVGTMCHVILAQVCFYNLYLFILLTIYICIRFLQAHEGQRGPTEANAGQREKDGRPERCDTSFRPRYVFILSFYSFY
jgi:hypothetical protein